MGNLYLIFATLIPSIFNANTHFSCEDDFFLSLYQIFEKGNKKETEARQNDDPFIALKQIIGKV